MTHEFGGISNFIAFAFSCILLVDNALCVFYIVFMVKLFLLLIFSILFNFIRCHFLCSGSKVFSLFECSLLL